MFELRKFLLKYIIIFSLVLSISSFVVNCSDRGFVRVVDSSLYYNDTIISSFGHDTIKISPYEQERNIEMAYSYLLLNIFSIYPNRVPEFYNGFRSPSELYYSINDTLKGGIYTVYVPQISANSFLSKFDIPKNYYFGFSFSSYDDTMFVLTVFENSAANKAGLKKDDKIIAIDKYPMNSNYDIYNAVVKDNYKEYSFVVKRNSILDTLHIKKDNVTMPISYGDSIAPNIGYIYLSTFIANSNTDGGSSSSQFEKAMQKISFAENIIIDIRGNPGGYINEAYNIAKLFLSKGDTLIKVIQREQSDVNDLEGVWDTNYVVSDNDGPYRNKKIIVLANGGSASASEILLSSLKYNANVLFVGSPTYGKAIGQTVFYAKNGGVAKITSIKLLMPNDHNYAHIGIQPDVYVSDGYEDFKDAVLYRALDYLNSDSALLMKKMDKSTGNYYNPFLKDSKNIIPYPEMGVKKLYLSNDIN